MTIPFYFEKALTRAVRKCLHRIKHRFVSLSIPRCHKYSQILKHHIIIILVFYIQMVPQIRVKITEMHTFDEFST